MSAGRVAVLARHLAAPGDDVTPVLARVPCFANVASARAILSMISELMSTWKGQGKTKDLSVTVVFEGVHENPSIWIPDLHRSFESYLRSLPVLKGYDVAQASLAFDKEGVRHQVVSKDDMTTYIAMQSRGPLFVTVPALPEIEKSVKNSPGLLSSMRKLGQSIMKKIVNSEVDEDVVKREEESLKDLTQCSEFRMTGDVKQFENVSKDDWKDFLDTMKEDNVPAKILTGLTRAAMAGGTEETMYDLHYKDGKLDHAYLVRLRSKNKAADGMDLLLFSYQLSFKGTDGQTLTPGQNLQIERFVHSASELFWKKKMITKGDDDDWD